jgi:hypothetical protein
MVGIELQAEGMLVLALCGVRREGVSELGIWHVANTY